MKEKPPIGSQQEIDELVLEYHRLIAARMIANPEAVIERARGNLKRWLANYERGSSDSRCLEEWEDLIETRSVDDLIAIITQESDEGQRLRSSTPFVGILSEQERKELRERQRAIYEERATV